MISLHRLIEPRWRSPRSGRAAGDELAGLVMRDAPAAVLAHEPVAGDQGAAAQLLLADDERGIAVEEHALIITGDAWRIGVGEDVAPALHHRVAIGQWRPSGMDAGDRRATSPQRVHRFGVAGGEG